MSGRAARRRCAVRWAAVAPLLLPATSQDLLAQERAAATQGRWLPREVRRFTNVTAAQQAEAIAVLDRVERILKQVPELANPKGFEILPVVSGGARQDGPGGGDDHARRGARS